jgi:glycosyltransferase involved in cell wall biosynthesis
MSTAAGVPEISVIIPTRDKAPRLRLTLACLAEQRDAPPTEVVLVDDGSKDNTAQVASAAGLPLRVVTGSGAGRATARNLGAARSRAPYLVFLDDDILVSPRFVAAHHAAARGDRFVHGRLRELVGADRLIAGLDGVSPAVIRARRQEVIAGTAGPLYRRFSNALERAVEGMADGSLPDVAPWLGCVGANVGMPRSAWQATGGFDERFGTRWGCEDLELGLRLHRAGIERHLAADALGIHLTHKRPDRWEQHAQNLELFARLHPIPAVTELPELLAQRGDPRRYVTAVLLATSGQGDDQRAVRQ